MWLTKTSHSGRKHFSQTLNIQFCEFSLSLVILKVTLWFILVVTSPLVIADPFKKMVGDAVPYLKRRMDVTAFFFEN